jgi:hypothetical protein
VKPVNITVIPAHPGYRTLHKTGRSWDVATTDVVAWRIDTYQELDGFILSDTRPVDLFGGVSSYAGYVDPSGRVALDGDEDFESFQDFLDHLEDIGEDITYPAELLG